VKVPSALIAGGAEDGYGKVADAFRRNFAEGREIGAAVAVYRHGRKVVDLWGGYREAKRKLPWQQDTLVTVFSTTKGMASMAMAVAHSNGLFDLDTAVAEYWPEFAQQGKEQITVRQLLAHEAGLPVIDIAIELALFDDPEAFGRVLAAQAPKWPPGTAHGYHGQSLGWYESQLLRRVDPKRRTIGHYFADEVAAPLGIDFHIGLPDDVPPDRLARMHYSPAPAALLHLNEIPPRLLFAILNPRTLTGRVFMNPKALRKAGSINRRDILRVEMPSVNGTGEVRGIAKAYGEFATGGGTLRISTGTISELEAPAPATPDRILKVDTAFSFGFMKPFPMLPFGSSTRAYGHTGMGGSFALADPDAGVGYAYGMNRMGFAVPTEQREHEVRQALYEVVGAPRVLGSQ
jgi:CubicO group peptidase (beta-lactamase class C family)